jgi:hypothetical protein
MKILTKNIVHFKDFTRVQNAIFPCCYDQIEELLEIVNAKKKNSISTAPI